MPLQADFTLEDGSVVTHDYTPEPTTTFDYNKEQAAQNLSIAFERTPDDQAQILELSEKSRWPSGIVSVSKKEAQEEGYRKDFQKIDEGLLLGFIGKSPDNAALVKDDIPQLRVVAGYLDNTYSFKLAEDVKKAYRAGDINTQLAPLYQRKFIDQEESEELDAQIEALEKSLQERPQRDDFFGEVATITAEQVPLVLEAVGVGAERAVGALPVIAPTTFIAGLATGGTGAVPFALGSLKATFALGVAEKIASMEAPFAAKEYSEFRDQNDQTLEPEVLKIASLVTGYLNAGIELTSDVATIGLLKKLPGFNKILSIGPRESIKQALKNKPFRESLKRISQTIAGTSLINGLEEATQELVKIFVGESAKELSEGEFEDITASDALKQVYESGRVGTLGGFGFGLGTGTISLGVSTVQSGVIQEIAKQAKERPQEYYDEQVGLAERLDETKTKTRSPKKVQEFLEEDPRMRESVPVDGEEAKVFYQTGDNSEIFTKLGVTEEEVVEAALGGQSLPIKLSEIHSKLTLEESKKFLAIIQESAESPSLAESKKINTTEELNRIQESLEQVNKEQNEFVAEKQRIEAEVLDVSKVRKIKQPEAYAKGVAELLGNFSLRMSTEADQAPADTLKRIRTEVSTFKDLAEAEEFLKANGLDTKIPRGVTQIMPEGFIMKLFEGANHSTLLHETGHVFLGEVESIVSLDKASEALQADYSAVREWLGAAPNEAITVAQQDKFAQAFELYLREGKAPTKGLRPFFERFKKWLTTVYRKIKGSPIDVGLTDDVRGVFDRLINVEEQSNQFIQENEFIVSDVTLNTLGVDKEAQLDFRRRLAGATATANEKVQQKLAQEYKKNIATWTKEAEIEVAGRRVNNLYEDLTSSKRGFNLAASSEFLTAKELNDISGRFPDAFTDEGLDPNIIRERFGYASVPEMFRALNTPLNTTTDEGKRNQAAALQDFIKRPILGLNQEEVEFQAGRQTAIRLKAKNANLVRPNGQSPSSMTLEYGYESVSAMLKDLENRIPRDAQVQGLIEQKERAHYLNFTAKDFFLNDANKGLEKSLETMGEFLRKKAGVEIEIPAKEYQRQAERHFTGLPVREAARTDWHLSAMRKSLRNRDGAIKKGKFKEAVKFQAQARLNYEFARKSNQIRRDQNALQDLVRKSDKNKSKIEFDYWKNIMSLGNKFGLRKGAEPQKVLPFQNLLDAQVSIMDSSVTFRPWIQNDPPQNFRDLSVNQFEELKVLFEVLNDVGRKIVADQTVLADMKFADLKGGLVEQALKVPDRTKVPPKLRDARKPLTRLTNWGKKVFSDINVLYNVMLALDGHQELGPKGTVGPWVQSVYEPLLRADSEQLRLKDEISTKMQKPLDQLANSFREQPKIIESITVPIPEVLANRDRNWYFDTVISIALNMGNRQNIEAVKEGYGFSESDLNNILEPLSREDWNAIQEIGDIIGSYREPLFSIKKKISGFEPTAVTGDVFEVAKTGQKLKGWYYPLKRDQSLISESVIVDFNKNFRNTETTAVADGPTQEREGFGGAPVKLNLDVLSQHVDFLALYLSHAQAMKDIGRIFEDKQVTELIVQKLGDSALQTVKSSLQNIARSEYEQLNTFDILFERFRGRATVYMLGLKPSTAFKQIFSLPIFWSEYGFGTHWKGLKKLAQAPFEEGWGALKEEVYRLSAFMKARSDNIETSISESVKKSFFEKPIPFAFGLKNSQIDSAMFVLIKAMDHATVYPAWIGAFEEGKLKFNGDINQAVTFADKAIRTTQPSFRPIDLSPIQNSRKGAARAFTMFSTVTLLIGRRHRTAYKAFRNGQISANQFMRTVILEGLVPPMGMTLAFAGFRGEFPEMKELLADLFAFNLGTIPLVKDMAYFAANVAKGKDFGDAWNSPLFEPIDLGNKLIRFIIKLVQDLDNDKLWKNAVLAMAELLSFTFKRPLPRVARDMIRGMEQWERGEGTPINVLIPQTPSR